jgi:hypothetical protein
LMQDQEEGMSKYQIWKQLMQVIKTLSYLVIITYSRFKKEGPMIVLQDDGFNLGCLILYIKNKETKNEVCRKLVLWTQSFPLGWNNTLFWVNIFEHRSIFFYLRKQYFYFVYRKGILLKGVSILEISIQYCWDSRCVVWSSK